MVGMATEQNHPAIEAFSADVHYVGLAACHYQCPPDLITARRFWLVVAIRLLVMGRRHRWLNVPTLRSHYPSLPSYGTV